MINTNTNSNLNSLNQQSYLDNVLSGISADKLTHGNILYVIVIFILFLY